MRIERLDLLAFGNLTDVVLDLSLPCLQIVYGPNEAGKSTTLAAVSNLLYGFDLRTTYAFRHPMSQLRLGALLSAEDSSTTEVVRYKRNKDSLVESGSEQPIGEARWNGLLQGVRRDDFDAMFTLGWDELVHGTDELLARGGMLGETLFGAGLGVRELGSVLKRLDEEAAALFLPRAATKTVNAALKAAAEARRHATELSVRPAHYAEVAGSHDRAIGRKTHLQAERRNLQGEHERLVTLRGVLPVISDRTRAAEERATLLVDGPPHLATWAERVQQAVLSRSELTTKRATATEQVRAAEEKLDGIAVDEALLAIAERVESLSEGITSYVQGRSDRAGLETGRRDAERDALAHLRALTGGEPDVSALEEARVVLAGKDEFAPARDEWVQKRAALEHARDGVRDCELEITDIEDTLALLPEPIDPSTLREAAGASVRQGDLDGKLSSAREALGNAQRARLEMAGRLGITEEEVDNALGRPSPSTEETEQILGTLEEAESNAVVARERAQDQERREGEVSEQLEALALEGELPSEADLADRRRVRDATWALVKVSWLEDEHATGKSSRYQDKRTLASSYEVAREDADRVVDRLWREADRTARRRTLLAELERARATREQESEKARHTIEEAKESYTTWCAAWPDQRLPESPGALRQRGANLEQLRSLENTWARTRLAHREAFRGHRMHRRRMVEVLRSLGIEATVGLDLEPVLVQAQKLVGELEENQRERSESELGLRTRELDLPKKRTGLTTAVESDRTSAAVLTSLLGPYGAQVESPQEASGAMARLDNLGQLLKARDSLLQRIQGIDKRCTAFEEELSELVISAPDIAQAPVPDGARELIRRVKDARAAHAKRQELGATRDGAKVSVDEAEANLVGLRDEFALLASEGQVDDPDQLEAAAQRAVRVIELDREVADCDKRLAVQGGGRSLPELEEAALGQTLEHITAAIDDRKQSLDGLDDELQQATDTEASLRHELLDMDGSDAAAAEAERGQRELNKAVEAAERYTRLVLARFLLDEAIRRYSEAHQDPLLKRASDHLRLLTGDDYQQVGVDVDSKTGPRLSTITAGGEELLVPQLSSGIRDQLYFALRLAAIEEAFTKHGPMPVLLDDVLVNFDDTHAMAALRILATLAGTRQVLLFTHHRHVLGLAKDALEPDVFAVHELELAAASGR